MTSPWEEWKKKNAERQETGVVRPWDVLNPDTQYVDEEESSLRMDICNGCEHLSITKQCDKCGCFMPLKVKLLHASCPIGKW